MENIDKGNREKQTGKGFTSVILAILIPAVAPFLLMPIMILDYSGLSDGIKMIITSVFVLILTGTPCYFICRYHPRSVWFVPIFAGIAIAMIAGGFLSNYWSTNAKIILLIASILIAIALSIWGAEKGKKRINENPLF